MWERNHTPVAQREIIDLAADLVVDASGRDSQMPRWLESLGYRPPAETVINPFFGYATRLYRPPLDAKHSWKGLAVLANPPTQLRGGVIWPIEGGDWIVVLGGTGSD